MSEHTVYATAVYPGVHDTGNGQKKEALDLQGLRSGGDSWTRTNDPIDVNDVLSLIDMFAAKDHQI